MTVWVPVRREVLFLRPPPPAPPFFFQRYCTAADMKRDSCGVFGSSLAAGPWQRRWETCSVLCHSRIPSASERVFGCRGMFFFPAGPTGKGRRRLRPSSLWKQKRGTSSFFFLFFNLKASEAASDVDSRSVHHRNGAHAEFLRWWHFQKRCHAAAVHHVASPPPNRRVWNANCVIRSCDARVVSHEACEMTCSQISRLHPHAAIPGWFSSSDTFPIRAMTPAAPRPCGWLSLVKNLLTSLTPYCFSKPCTMC